MFRIIAPVNYPESQNFNRKMIISLRTQTSWTRAMWAKRPRISTHVTAANDACFACVRAWHCCTAACPLQTASPSVGRWCWSPSRWALNHPCFLANSQHKYPRRNTEVTLGSTIFQSPVCASPASQITSSLTAFCSVTFSLSPPGPIFLSFISY